MELQHFLELEQISKVQPIPAPTSCLSVTHSHSVYFNYFQPNSTLFNATHPSVTLVTYSSPKRLQTLPLILDRWKGPISLALYLSKPTDLLALQKLRDSNPKVSDQVWVHLVWKVEGEEFPINFLRNVAETNVMTTHSFHCDIDFIPSMNAFETVTEHGDELLNSLKHPLVFVIPAFEFQRRSIKRTKFPATIEELVPLFHHGQVQPFHFRCKKCQQATHYKRWLTQSKTYTSNPANPKSIDEGYEPFIILPTHFLKWNECFVGYGRDKTIYFYELRQMLGCKTMILPDIFIIHHDHECKNNPEERIRMYLQEKEKLILQYRKKQKSGKISESNIPDEDTTEGNSLSEEIFSTANGTFDSIKVKEWLASVDDGEMEEDAVLNDILDKLNMPLLINKGSIVRKGLVQRVIEIDPLPRQLQVLVFICGVLCVLFMARILFRRN